MSNKYSIILIFILSAIISSCGADQNVKKGDRLFALGEYFDAANQYKAAYTKTPIKERTLRGKRALKMAECYRKINFTQRAIAAYLNAIRYKQTDSLTNLNLGMQYLKDGNYKEAEKIFSEILVYNQNNNLAKEGFESAREAPLKKKEPSSYIIKYADAINSRRADYSPMLYGDEYNQLYFTSTRNQSQGNELSGITGTKNGDIFFCQKDDKGNWGKVQTIESGLNSVQDEGACSFTPDNHTMYLTKCDNDPQYPRYATICTSNRSDALWTKPTNLEITKDTLSSYAHPAISPDGKWLYFTSDMPGGLGGLDIWRVRLTTNGLGGVENLGAPINTPGDEEFPTLRPNGDLYFSSNGHVGLGGLDIYIAKLDTTSNKWKVEHPGYPLNSQGDDFGMTFEGLHNRGYFSSNRGDAHGWDHIYSFEKPEIVQTVKGWVYEKEAYELSNAMVRMVGNDGTNLKLTVKRDGSFTQEIHPNIDYVFLATCKGFLNHKEQLRVTSVKESTEYTLQFPLASITAPVLIDNIFYDFNKATLTAESTKALDELISLLNENPNITIELRAHCDYRGSSTYNKVLSQKRAEAVASYLIRNGIAKDRLSPVGYGKDRPKIIRKRLTEKYPWLKENDVLSAEFISKLDKEKQEICNQINRRTEFVVLRTTYGIFDKYGNLKNIPSTHSAKDNNSQNNADLF